MNEHEIQRIALAMNQLRPDWPTAQLRTLLTDARMVNRPRRDVAVALSWVAAEPNSANPYRVLEAGPWWRAAGVEGGPTSRIAFDPAATCSTCGKHEATCRRNPHSEHGFVSIEAYRVHMARYQATEQPELRALMPATNEED